MKALILYEKEVLTLDEISIPDVLDNEVLIQVAYCGICGTDVHKYHGISGSRPLVLPIPLGHEVSGIISKVGENVQSLKIKDRVVVDPNWHCKECLYCKDGLTHLCDNSRGVVKGMAEYIAVPMENVYAIPDNLPLLTASLAEPLSCCLRAIEQGNIKPYQKVVIIGFGAIGKIIAELLSTIHCELVVIENNDNKRTEVEAIGATFIHSSSDGIANDLLNTSKERVHCIIECVGKPETITLAIDIANKGSNIVIFGVTSSQDIAHFSPYQAFLKELSIKTSYINPHTMGQAIKILASNTLNTDSIIQGVISMEEAVSEFETLKNIKRGKTIVKISGE